MQFAYCLVVSFIAIAASPAALAQGGPACPTVSLPPTAELSDVKSLPNTVRDTHERMTGVPWFQTAAEYQVDSLVKYRQATAALDRALAVPNWTAATEQTATPLPKPTAVIMDLDETVLDNSLFQGELGIRLPDPATLDTVLTRKEMTDWTSDKSTRRALVAKGCRILLVLGDDLGDFISPTPPFTAPAPTPQDRTTLAEKYSDHWGTSWFLISNPLYGNWEAATYGNDFQKPDAAVLIGKNVLVKRFWQMAPCQRRLS
jgi:predicted secreted acid phosphatase